MKYILIELFGTCQNAFIGPFNTIEEALDQEFAKRAERKGHVYETSYEYRIVRLEEPN